MGASMFGLATGIDYGVVFGAFAGAVFYVATAVNISRLKLVGYFITSFIFGVIVLLCWGLTSQSGRGTVTGRLMHSVL